MYSVITWGTELLNQLGILQDRMSLFRIGSNNLLMIFSIYILKHSRFMKTFEHTAISKSIYMVNLKYMVYPACKMVSDLSEFFFVHFRFTSTQDLSKLFNVLQFSKISIQQEERIWSTKPCKMVSDLSTINCN